MIPKPLEQIRDFLKKDPVQLSRNLPDGRVNASTNEREIIEKIKSQFDIEDPKERHWYDFSIPNGNEKIPVNIKVTTTETADNVQCKLGIYYALTGQWPDFSNETPWGKYFSLLRNNINKAKDKDYYFLIVNNTNSSDVFCTSLKQINRLVANGNNLPFQCNWGENRTLAKRSHDDAVRFLLGSFYESIKLRTRIYHEFKAQLGSFV